MLHLVDLWQVSHDDVHETSAWGAGTITQDEMDANLHHVRGRFAKEIAGGTVAIHRAPSIDAASEFPDSYFDWIYIDGDHLYEAVRGDIEAWSVKVKPGGLIAGDDYEDGWWGEGVQRAVNEFVTDTNAELVTNGSQFIIRKFA